MLQAMLLSHLLGDFVLQTDALARWKSRSLWGGVVHGGAVTLCTWLCSLPFSRDWWPYALAVGIAHTSIDLIRTSLGDIGPSAGLFLFLGDQAAHWAVLLSVVRWSGWQGIRPAETAVGAWLQDERRMTFIIGYVLLTMPAWVLVHFVVKGTGAISKSLPGRPGEKYLGIVERGLIATFVMLGEFLLIPLVVAPRLALDGIRYRVDGERIGYLGELLTSVSLAVGVGLILRGL